MKLTSLRTLSVLLLILFASTLFAQVTPTFHPPNPFPDPDKWYFIELTKNGTVVEIPDVSIAQNNKNRNDERIRLRLNPKNNSDYQQWRFLESDIFKGFYRIINKGSNLVMEVPYSSTDPGSHIQQYKMLSQTTKAQFFKLINLCNTDFFITPLLNGFVFTAEKETQALVFNPASNGMSLGEIRVVDGWFVRQFRLGSSELQRWKLIEAE